MKTNEFITTSSAQTKKLGALLAKELSGGEVICLSGDLGAGKTTFTQGLLLELGASGPFTSPTFAIMKEYQIAKTNLKTTKDAPAITHVYHIDAYRINADDLLGLGWQDFAGKQNSVVLIEWAERTKRIIPKNSLWLNFEWLNEKERKITLSSK